MAEYQQYGGNPYGNSGPQGYGHPPTRQTDNNASPAHLPSILTSPDFLSRVEAVKNDIERLSTNISLIASLHQRTITSTNPSTSTLEGTITQTQILNTHIRDQIKYLETDAARSDGNPTKNSQVRNLKTQFRVRLEQYRQEEVEYKKRYQEQIARQYRIVNPGASDDEVREAVGADWGDEGVFQTAVSTINHITYYVGLY
jgi:syntaxin 1B/2/3